MRHERHDAINRAIRAAAGKLPAQTSAEPEKPRPVQGNAGSGTGTEPPARPPTMNDLIRAEAAWALEGR